MRDGSKQIRPHPTLSAELSVGLDPMTPRSRPELKPGGRHLTDGATGARTVVFLRDCCLGPLERAECAAAAARPRASGTHVRNY